MFRPHERNPRPCLKHQFFPTALRNVQIEEEREYKQTCWYVLLSSWQKSLLALIFFEPNFVQIRILPSNGSKQDLLVLLPFISQ